MSGKAKILYTKTDEAPALATRSFLPIVQGMSIPKGGILVNDSTNFTYDIKNERIIIPISEDFLLYHKDSEKYEKGKPELNKRKKYRNLQYRRRLQFCGQADTNGYNR